MILHAVELAHVGRFREPIRIGPFYPGLNVLAAANESGKSTAIHAAARALFDRHSTRSEEIKALQPAGTALAPRVAVEFETRAGRFRIAKTFLQKPDSQLFQWRSDRWELVADADVADQRLQALLQSALPGRGATKPEHWGFLGFLWARQGEPAAWPAFAEGETGPRIRARLARVELDPTIERLRVLLATTSEGIITSTGQSRAGGPLRQAEDDLAAVDAALAEVRRTRVELDDALRRYQRSEAEVDRLEKEHAERTAAAEALRQQAAGAERLRTELEARQLALAGAQEKLSGIVADTDRLAQRRRELAEIGNELARARVVAQGADQSLLERRTRLESLHVDQPRFEAELHAVRAAHQRSQSLVRLRRLTTAAGGLARQLQGAEESAAAVAVLGARRDLLPAVSPAKLKKLEALAEASQTLRTRLEALGLTVELTPDKDASLRSSGGDGASVQALPAGLVTRLHSPQALDLHLEGWGRLRIRSGSREAQSAAADFAQAEEQLRHALQEAAVPHLAAARDAVAGRREIDAQIDTARATLATRLSEHETLEALRQAAAAESGRARVLADTLVPTAEEQALDLADLEAAESALAERVDAAEKVLAAFHRQLAEGRASERQEAQAAQEAARRVGEHESRLRALEAAIAALADRYPGGIDAARTAAQLAFAQAEARVLATQGELPSDFERLPERNRRAAAALEQIANELRSRRSERDQARGTLETLGGQGLYSRETELEERREEALLRRAAARDRGWCARVAHDLIEHRKQAATKAALEPLEQRLTTAFAELTGDATRRVFLDENLQIAGIGRAREESHAFEQLSQGAKEQLLLCLRLAVARELAADEPQVLILDDVLVNTDPVRQDRVLDVLGAEAQRLQVLVLTCHPDRYRGVGRLLGLGPG